VAVPNLVNILSKQDFQGVGQTESEALANCLAKIKAVNIEELFPRPADEKKLNLAMV
jgi:hypothetical protein